MWISAPSVLIGTASLSLLAHTWRPLRGRLSLAAALAIGGLAALAWSDAAAFARVLADSRIDTPAWIPGSLITALILTALGIGLLRTRTRVHRRLPVCVGFSGLLAGLPILFMLTFGPTRYERPADCAVVLGAKVYDDGIPSLALADRTDEGIRLYQAGLVEYLIMSGGIDPRNGHSEARVMRARAVAAGVPATVILLDESGNNTAATVRNTSRIMRARGLTTVLTVSHYYHQPRLKVLFARTDMTAYTIPARMTRRLVLEPYFVVREAAAFYNSLLRETPGRLAS